MRIVGNNGRALAGLLALCAALALWALLARRGAERVTGSGEPVAPTAATEPRAPRDAGLTPAEPAEPADPTRTSLAASSAPAREPEADTAAVTLTGRLQLNGYAPSRGRVWLRTRDGSFERRLVIDPYGRFHAEGVPAGELLLGFEAEGLFERQLVLPDRFELTTRAGELAVVDLDWWTRQVNVFVSAADGLPGPARIGLRGPGYASAVPVDESGIVRLDLVGQGIFTFDVVTPGGLAATTELEFEPGDGLDTAVLLARVKDH